MSWDVLFQDLPRGIRSIADIPDDFAPEPLCTRAELVEKVRSVVPDADFSDPSWGVLEGEGYSIEVNAGDEDPVNGFMLHVRGGDVVMGVIHDLAKAFDVVPLDCGLGLAPAGLHAGAFPTGSEHVGPTW